MDVPAAVLLAEEVPNGRCAQIAAKTALQACATVRERAVKLAELVSVRLGGFWVTEAEVQADLLGMRSHVVQLGRMTKGNGRQVLAPDCWQHPGMLQGLTSWQLRRHRSILFKAIADSLPPELSVPARLVRGYAPSGYAGLGTGQDVIMHSWNVVR